MKKLIVFLFAIVTVLSFSNCGRRGCTDIDADNYDDGAKRDDGDCMYRFASGINVNAFPTLDGNGNLWDPTGGPDVYVRFAKQSSATWDYVSSTASDSYAPTSLLVSGGIKFTNEDWQFQLMDYDWPSADDVIASGTFNPVTTGGGGSITVLTSNGSSVTFQYSLNQ